MITNVKPMSTDHRRALAMAYELHRLLGEIARRRGYGLHAEALAARNALDDVIAHLEPDENASEGLRDISALRREDDERR
jgi:hypothetical protein